MCPRVVKSIRFSYNMCARLCVCVCVYCVYTTNGRRRRRTNAADTSAEAPWENKTVTHRPTIGHTHTYARERTHNTYTRRMNATCLPFSTAVSNVRIKWNNNNNNKEPIQHGRVNDKAISTSLLQ